MSGRTDVYYDYTQECSKCIYLSGDVSGGFPSSGFSHPPNAAISANGTTVIIATKKRIFMINPSVPFSNKQININKKEEEEKKKKRKRNITEKRENEILVFRGNDKNGCKAGSMVNVLVSYRSVPGSNLCVCLHDYLKSPGRISGLSPGTTENL